jgi:hypothetical protein
MALTNFSLPFTLETDASGNRIGAILMQQGRPLAYFSKTLGVKSVTLCPPMIKMHWPFWSLDTLKQWRHYLLDSDLLVNTDQKKLEIHH